MSKSSKDSIKKIISNLKLATMKKHTMQMQTNLTIDLFEILGPFYITRTYVHNIHLYETGYLCLNSITKHR